MVRIFISHSHLDKDAAEALVKYLRASLPLEMEDIRCTSVSGYQIKTDANIPIALQKDLKETKCLIALITKDSLCSTWTLFELGAAWVNQKHITLILGPGISSDRVPEPLSGRIFVKIEKENLSDAVNKIAEKLGIYAKPATSIDEKRKKFIDEFKQSRCSSPVGSWLWDSREFPAHIYPNFKVKGRDKRDETHETLILNGKWEYIDRQKGEIKVTWETTTTYDYLTISEDGNSMSGKNDKGHENLHVIRYLPKFPQ
jgi:hypothetical protein